VGDARAQYLANPGVLTDNGDSDFQLTDVRDVAVDPGVLIGPPIQQTFAISNTPVRIATANNSLQWMRIENQGSKTCALVFGNIGDSPTIISSTPSSILAAAGVREFDSVKFIPNTDVWAITPTASDTSTLYVEQGY